MSYEEKQLQLNNEQFKMWANFMSDTQIARVVQYVNGNYEQNEEDKAQFREFIQQLDNIDQEFTNMKDSIEEAIQERDYQREQKQERLASYEQETGDAEEKMKETEEEMNRKIESRKQLLDQFTTEQQIMQLKQVPNEEFKNLLQLYGLVFFEQKDFEWKQFRYSAFGIKENTNPQTIFSRQQQQQQQQQYQQYQQQQQQQQNILNSQGLRIINEVDENKNQSINPLHKQEEGVIEFSDNEQEQEGPLSQNVQSNRQQGKRTLFKQKMTHLKVDELTENKRTQLEKYFSNKDAIIETKSYKENYLGFVNLFNWLQNLLEIDRATRQYYQDQKQFSQSKRILDEQRRLFNIDFDTQVIKQYTTEIEDCQNLKDFIESLTQILQNLDQKFEGQEYFFKGELEKMQMILNELDGKLIVPDDIYEESKRHTTIIKDQDFQ